MNHPPPPGNTPSHRAGAWVRARRALRRLAERLLGVKIYSLRAHGRDDCHDIRSSGDPVRVIVDVGANVGQSAAKFREAFPRAVIHCVEPASRTFRALQANLASDPAVTCHHLALGEAAGTATLWLTAQSSTCSLVERPDAVGSESVSVQTLDGFARSAGLQRIDLLKVDTEGGDLGVLAGAESLLASGRIGYVLVEVGFDPTSRAHVPFDRVRDHLLARGFSLFGIYDQTLEWSGEKRLRFANACFRRNGP